MPFPLFYNQVSQTYVKKINSLKYIKVFGMPQANIVVSFIGFWIFSLKQAESPR